MRRRVSRSVLLSIALHCVLVSALLGIRFKTPPLDQSPILSFELVQLENGRFSRSGRDRAAPDAAAAHSSSAPFYNPDDNNTPSARSPSRSESSTRLPVTAGARADSEPQAESTPQAASRPQTASTRQTASGPQTESTPQPASRSLTASAPQTASTRQTASGPRAEDNPPPKPKPQTGDRTAENDDPRREASNVRKPAGGGASQTRPVSVTAADQSSRLPAVPTNQPKASAHRSEIEKRTHSAELSAAVPAPAASLSAVSPEPPAIPVSKAQQRKLRQQIDKLAARLDAARTKRAAASAASQALPASLSWKHRGQEYHATFESFPAQDSMHLDRVLMYVTTEQNGQQLRTKLQLKRLAFSSFAQFVNRWDPDVQIHDDRIDGRFHSNSEIYVQKRRGIEPKFFSKVTTADGVDTSSSQGVLSRHDVFLGGLETNVRPILMPPRFLLFTGAAAEDGRVQRIDADARIIFYADGSYTWRYLDSTAPAQRRRLPDAPYYLVAARKAALHLQGVVNGTVLVYSPEEIVIEGDLTYAADPKVEAGADDFLGIVSDKDVAIADPEVTGPGDLKLQASIYARRRFVVRDFMSGERSTLSLYGSLSAGSLSATEPRYRTDIHFDRRFENLRPPHFPMTDHYEISSWNGKWSVEPDDPQASSGRR